MIRKFGPDPEKPDQLVETWDRGQGYPRDERGLPKEGVKAYQKFRQFLSQGPRRTKVATARAFGAAPSSIHELATKYRWDERALAWDERYGLATPRQSENPLIDPEIPERLQEVASQPPAGVPGVQETENPVLLDPVEATIRAKEQEHERMLEEFRSEAELLGRRQMQIARGMTSLVGSSVAEMLTRREILNARSIPGFISAACTLAAAANHNWGRAIGVDRLLLQMEQAVAELERRTVEDAEVIG